MARILLTGWLILAALPGHAEAQREHVVRSGQSLARIAQRYRVSVANLAAANRLRRNAQVRPGQRLRIPEEGVAYVGPGETLGTIARRHETTVRELRRINRIQPGATIRVGQRVRLPTFAAAQDRQEAASRWGRVRNPGVVRLKRRHGGEQLRVRLVDSRGRARRVAIRRLQEMMRPRQGLGGRLGPAPPARLAEILARISDHFGGRRITIVSGFRPGGRGGTPESSHHTNGTALDIRIQGVPNHLLRDYIRATFNNVGVGYYPRSHFVHVDVRNNTRYWVDWSRPGEPPRYQRRGQPAPDDATAEELRHTGFPGRRQQRRARGQAAPANGESADARQAAPANEEGADGREASDDEDDSASDG